MSLELPSGWGEGTHGGIEELSITSSARWRELCCHSQLNLIGIFGSENKCWSSDSRRSLYRNVAMHLCSHACLITRALFGVTRLGPLAFYPPILQYSAACSVLTGPCALRRRCVNFSCLSNASSLRSGHFAPTTDSCRALLYSNLGDRCRWSAFCVCLICGGTHLAALMMHFDLCTQIRAGFKVSVHIATGAYR